MRSKTDWENIKITLIPADEENVNPYNLSGWVTPKDRLEEIINISARIWSRYVFEKLEERSIYAHCIS